jgi:hypothetical protein
MMVPLLAGCGGMGGLLGGTTASATKPPYVDDEPKAKTQKPCATQSSDSKDKASQSCKQPEQK